jgi:hypothetical protein
MTDVLGILEEAVPLSAVPDRLPAAPSAGPGKHLPMAAAPDETMAASCGSSRPR